MFKLLTAILMIFILPLTALDNSKENQINEKEQSFPAEQIRVEINRQGSVFLNGNVTDLSTLRAYFDEAPKNPDDSILIVADEQTSKEDVIKVMDICCNYKYNNIRLVYKPSWAKS